jgi:hypothetical protein
MDRLFMTFQAAFEIFGLISAKQHPNTYIESPHYKIETGLSQLISLGGLKV